MFIDIHIFALWINLFIDIPEFQEYIDSPQSILDWYASVILDPASTEAKITVLSREFRVFTRTWLYTGKMKWTMKIEISSG